DEHARLSAGPHRLRSQRIGKIRTRPAPLPRPGSQRLRGRGRLGDAAALTEPDPLLGIVDCCDPDQLAKEQLVVAMRWRAIMLVLAAVLGFFLLDVFLHNDPKN